MALAVVARTAGGDDIHPFVNAVLGERDDVFTGQVVLVKLPTAVCAQIAVARKQFAIGQARAQAEWADVGHALGADDAVDSDDRLLAGACVEAAMKHGNLRAHFPAHFLRRVVNDRLLQRNPRLGQPLR